MSTPLHEETTECTKCGKEVLQDRQEEHICTDYEDKTKTPPPIKTDWCR